MGFAALNPSYGLSAKHEVMFLPPPPGA